MAHFDNTDKRVHVIRLHAESNGQFDYSEKSYSFNCQTSANILPDDLFEIVRNEFVHPTQNIAVTIFSGNAVSEKSENKELLNSLGVFRFYNDSAAQKIFFTKDGMLAIVSNF